MTFCVQYIDIRPVLVINGFENLFIPFVSDYLLVEDITVDEIYNLFYLEEYEVMKVCTLNELLEELIENYRILNAVDN